MKTVETNSPVETFLLGKTIGEQARPGEVVTLSGDLGAGKTVFAKGVAAGLDISEPVTSPTFTILQEYHGGRLPLYHFDIYRIEDPEEMHETGFSDLLAGDGLCLIEWAERIAELLPADCTRVIIERNPEHGENFRTITIEDTGSTGKGGTA